MVEISKLDRIINLAQAKVLKSIDTLSSLDNIFKIVDSYKTIEKYPQTVRYFLVDLLFEANMFEGKEYSIIERNGKRYITSAEEVELAKEVKYENIVGKTVVFKDYKGNVITGKVNKIIDKNTKPYVIIKGMAVYVEDLEVIESLQENIESKEDVKEVSVVVKKANELECGDIIQLYRTTATVIGVSPTTATHTLVELEIVNSETKRKYISRSGEYNSKEYSVIGKDLKYAIKVTENQCPECGGTGILTHYMHIDNGVCYKCMGTGKRK